MFDPTADTSAGRDTQNSVLAKVMDIPIPQVLTHPSIPPEHRLKYQQNARTILFRTGIQKVLDDQRISVQEFIELDFLTQQFGVICKPDDSCLQIANLSAELADIITIFIKHSAEDANGVMLSSASTEVIRTYHNVYNAFLQRIRKLQIVCRALDKIVISTEVYNAKSSKLQDIQTIGLRLWIRNFFVRYWEQIVTSAIGVYQEAADESETRMEKLGFLKSFTDSLLLMGACEYDEPEKRQLIFENYFENSFIATREMDLKDLCLRISENLPNPYLKMTIQYEHTEIFLLQQAFPSSTTTKSKILEKFAKIFLVDHIDKVFQEMRRILEEIFATEENNVFEHLITEFTTFYQTIVKMGNEHLTKIVETFSEQVVDVWKHNLDLIEQPQPGQRQREVVRKSVSKLLIMHERVNRISDVIFKRHKDILGVVKNALSKFIQERKSRTNTNIPRQLALYVDILMKKEKHTKKDDDMITEPFPHIISIYKLMDGKDQFLSEYTKYLSLRLIQGVSVSLDKEAEFINAHLKPYIGYDPIRIPSSMISDVQLSSTRLQEFKNYQLERAVESSFDLNVLNLPYHNWKIRESNPEDFAISYPETLGAKLSEYYSFVLANHPKRKLEWIYSKFHGLIMFNPKTSQTPKIRSYRITASIYQITALLQFENGGTKNYAELLELTGMKSIMLDHVLGIFTQVKLLIKGSTDQYTLNDEFKFKHPTLNINVPLKQNEDGEAELKESRKIRLLAWGVRLLKTFQVSTKSHLVQEMINIAANNNSGFTPDVQMIDEAIKQMISEGIAEVDANTGSYKYIA